MMEKNGRKEKQVIKFLNGRGGLKTAPSTKHQPWWCWIVRNKNLDGLSDRKCDVLSLSLSPPLFTSFSQLKFSSSSVLCAWMWRIGGKRDGKHPLNRFWSHPSAAHKKLHLIDRYVSTHTGKQAVKIATTIIDI